jgi:hypothetical protein
MGEFTGLNIDDAVDLAERKLDETFAELQVRQRALMIDHGLSRDDQELLLSRQREFWSEDRLERREELRARLLLPCVLH